MKALTIREPWVSLLLSGRKTIETRPWAAQHRGGILLHAGRRFDVSECERFDVKPHAPGHIVGSAVLVDVVPIVRARSAAGRLLRDEQPVVLARAHEAWLYRPHRAPVDVSAQLEFGAFRSGYQAWLMSSAARVEQRCPSVVAGSPEVECPLCDGSGVCEPIPARGHQSVWEWTP